MDFLAVLNEIDNFIWGPPLLVLLVGTGILLTIRLHLLQIFKLPKALSLIFRAQNAGSGDIDSFKALCTALSATVGTGNIVGVATAIHAGGPGALFWMWMAAFFGMATKYAEGLLAVKYRETDEKGEIAGGPMYYIKNGMGEKYKWLGGLFAFFGVLVAYFGIGTFAQVNSIVDITKMTIGLDPVWTGAILTIFVAAITIGGLQSIAAAASRIVPAMAFIYFLSTIGVLLVFADKVPAAVSMIFESAFTTTAATGGFLGATVMMAMKNGVARGVFSNESGLGSAPIVAAAAKEAGVKIVTGDTKVVERGKADGIYINTCGVGVLPKGIRLSGANCRPGDVIAISGDIGDHGVAVMSQRVNLGFETGVVSDSASLNRLTEKLVAEIPSLRCMRDPTRGGLGTTLNEIAKQSSVGMVLEEDKIPVKESVEAACEFLGLDPLYVANEGKVIAICAPEDAERMLKIMRDDPLGKNAQIIGRCIEDENHFVQMETGFGGVRMVDWLTGEQLPRIC